MRTDHPNLARQRQPRPGRWADGPVAFSGCRGSAGLHAMTVWPTHGARMAEARAPGASAGRRVLRHLQASSALLLLLGLLLPSAPATARTEGALLRRADPAAIAAARRFLCPHGGAPVRGLRGRCRGTPGSAATAAEPSPSWWDQGLPPAARRQQPCPAGTTPTPAVARSDSTRCLPE